DLQALDTRLSQIAHRKATLPELAELRELDAQASSLDDDLVRAQTALDDIQREIVKADTDVQLVRERSTRDQARMEAGQGTAKDMQALQHEVDSLANRQSALEDIELEVMERAEALTVEVSRLEAARAQLVTRADELKALRDKAFAELDAEVVEIGRSRADVVAGVGDDLVGLYEKIRDSSGGIGAAVLRQRRCGGCNLELNQGEMNRFTAAAQDEVLRCEECRRILVRTSESGV
ncbi:MAG TPA: C4-type zinc ribbon domain-containing protein, partial [Dermatophilaceae bacterium]